MKFIINESFDPKFNLALEEYTFKNLLEENLIVILWINSPSIIVGKHQNTFEEINADFVRGNNIEVLRRISGGGTVYHDYNNLNYSLISNEDNGREFNFKNFSIPVIKTLNSIGVNAVLTKRNDIVVDDKKICGHAQAYINGRVLHHGCLLFNSDLQDLSKALKPPQDILMSKGVKSCRSKVTNVASYLSDSSIDIHQFKSLLKDSMFREYPDLEEYHLSESQLCDIRQLAKEKYSTWQWNYGRSPMFSVKKTLQISDLEIDCILKIKDGLINQVEILNEDLLSNTSSSDIQNFISTLQGQPYTP